GRRAQQVQHRPQREALTAVALEPEIDLDPLDPRRLHLRADRGKVGGAEVAAQQIVEVHFRTASPTPPRAQSELCVATRPIAAMRAPRPPQPKERPMHYVYLMIAIVGEVIGTSFMKQSDGFTRLVPSLITAAGYAVAFYFLSLTL